MGGFGQASVAGQGLHELPGAAPGGEQVTGGRRGGGRAGEGVFPAGGAGGGGGGGQRGPQTGMRWRGAVPGGEGGGLPGGGGWVGGEVGQQQNPVAGGDDGRCGGVGHRPGAGPCGVRITGLQQRLGPYDAGLRVEGDTGEQVGGAAGPPDGQRGAGGGQPYGVGGGGLGAGEQQQFGAGAAGGGRVGGGDRPLVCGGRVAGRRQVPGGVEGVGDQVGESPVQGSAAGVVEHASGDLRLVRRHRGDRTVVADVDQVRGGEFDDAVAEQRGRCAATEQAEGGQRGAGRSGQVGDGGRDRVADLVEVVTSGGRWAAAGGVAGQGGGGQGVPAGVAGQLRDPRRVQRGSGAVDQVGGGRRVQRRHRQPAGGGVPHRRQRGLGQQVRGAYRDEDPAVSGDGGQHGDGGRVGPLQVVEDEQAVAYPGTDRFGEQGEVVDGQPDPQGVAQRERGDVAQAGEGAAGVDGAGERGGDPPQQGAAAAAGGAGDDDEAGSGESAGDGGEQVVGGGPGGALGSGAGGVSAAGWVPHSSSPLRTRRPAGRRWHEHGILRR